MEGCAVNKIMDCPLMARNTVCRSPAIFILAFFISRFLIAFCMKISIKCPRCYNKILLSSTAADRRITCPKCLILFKVPAMDELGEALNAIKGTRGGVFVDEKGNCFG